MRTPVSGKRSSIIARLLAWYRRRISARGVARRAPMNVAVIANSRLCVCPSRCATPASFFHTSVTFLCSIVQEPIGWFSVGQGSPQREPPVVDANTDFPIDAPPAAHVP